MRCRPDPGRRAQQRETVPAGRAGDPHFPVRSQQENAGSPRRSSWWAESAGAPPPVRPHGRSRRRPSPAVTGHPFRSPKRTGLTNASRGHPHGAEPNDRCQSSSAQDKGTRFGKGDARPAARRAHGRGRRRFPTPGPAELRPVEQFSKQTNQAARPRPSGSRRSCPSGRRPSTCPRVSVHARGAPRTATPE